jgi:hypothetical protein
MLGWNPLGKQHPEWVGNDYLIGYSPVDGQDRDSVGLANGEAGEAREGGR